ncbi:aldehyde dehydrogenase family protein [Streptomyces sp. MA25(2023)]|uniref:aldehyde dehydrogenase family protein n=1 Tax=Streptomyces sp. MA25(2023) TaxID=3055078 RepID=UPI0025AF5311|nr:aldehyde dehydrogenase family protein [Streptomyces sp. MA25(2023)]MDN3254059.1 aldehyde dehydrogenase family protein [Streptomyces sp. MA25(2023)]
MYAVTDPSTGTTTQTYPTATDAEVATAVDAANAAAAWGRRTSVAERAALVRRLGDLHAEHRAELAASIVREMGKPLDEAEGEIDFCVDIYHYYADHAEEFLADEELPVTSGPGRAVVRRSPVGALLGIMPWNFPAYQVARFAAPNLALGNTIVLKHAPQCPATAALLERLVAEAGFPAGAYVNVYATNEQIAEVIADPRIQGVSLTGSERAGAAVAEIAGRHLKKVVLELGGSDPFLVLSTDDLDAVVDAAVAARLDNTGQACNAAKRFIVTSDLYDAFVEKFTAALLARQSGAPLSSVAAADTLERQVAAAVAEGATLHTEGERSGAHFPAGVLTGLTTEHATARQELFGPVAMVFRRARRTGRRGCPTRR